MPKKLTAKDKALTPAGGIVTPEPKEIALKYGFLLDGEVQKKVTMRSPVNRDSIVLEMQHGNKVAQSPILFESRMIEHLCSVPPETFDDLRVCDVMTLKNEYVNFLS